MVVRTASSPLNFIFNLTHLLHLSQQWLTRVHAIDVDRQMVIIGVMTVIIGLIILFQQFRILEMKRSNHRMIRENPILTFFQREMMGWSTLYIHMFHAKELESDPEAPYLLITIGVVITYILLVHVGILRDRSKSWLCDRFSFWWRRMVFFLPSDPMECFWLPAGYLIARHLFPITAGVHTAGGELCAYDHPRSVHGTGVSVDAEVGVRGGMDLSCLALIFAGIVWPTVEFVRTVTIGCAALHNNTTTTTTTEKLNETTSKESDQNKVDLATTPKTSDTKNSKKKRKQSPVASGVSSSTPDVAAVVSASSSVPSALDAAGVDSASVGVAGMLDSSSVGFFSRTLAFSHMSIACLAITWSINLATIANAYEQAIVRTSQESACPTIGTMQYARDLAMVTRDCTPQWSHIQSIAMLTSSSVGILGGVFGSISTFTFLHSSFRIQLFLILAMSLWTDTVIPRYTIIATHCIAM